jgi:hypothetical protein
VNSAVMPAAQHREVRERRRATVGPMVDVVTLPEAHAAAWEATALVTMLQRSSNRRRNRSCPGADLDQTPRGVLTHENPGRVAREALRRSGRNARPALEHRLPGLLGVGQDGSIDVHNHLIALSQGTGIDALVERGLGKQRECVGLQLLHRRRIVVECFVAGLWYRHSRAASSALRSKAPISGVNRPLILTVPSSS